MSYVRNARPPFDVDNYKDASHESIVTVLAADETSEDGRSQWFWIRFDNGDLAFACWPQGDTYFATEEDHSS